MYSKAGVKPHGSTAVTGYFNQCNGWLTLHRRETILVEVRG